MIFFGLRLTTSAVAAQRRSWRRLMLKCTLMLMIALGSLLLMGTTPALAGMNDDHFDGNIFVLYAGNGSLVPPRVTLEQSIKRNKPALLVFYADDSSDCKQYAIVVSQLQAFYGRAADFIPVAIDSIPIKSDYAPTEPGYYYKGKIPQTVIIDQKGEVAFNGTGQVAFEQVDDAFRGVFDLLPRSESTELKRRTVNEFNTELSR